VTTVTKVTEEKKYRVVNRSQNDRTLLIEHANRTNQQFKLVDTPKPVEDTPDVYRFQTPVKAGETKTYTVKEEKDISSSIQLTNNADDTIRHFINLSEASPALKQKLHDALKVKESWDVARRELAQIQADLQRLCRGFSDLSGFLASGPLKLKKPGFLTASTPGRTSSSRPVVPHEVVQVAGAVPGRVVLRGVRTSPETQGNSTLRRGG
jgi:hypothetical protein